MIKINYIYENKKYQKSFSTVESYISFLTENNVEIIEEEKLPYHQKVVDLPKITQSKGWEVVKEPSNHEDIDYKEFKYNCEDKECDKECDKDIKKECNKECNKECDKDIKKENKKTVQEAINEKLPYDKDTKIFDYDVAMNNVHEIVDDVKNRLQQGNIDDWEKYQLEKRLKQADNLLKRLQYKLDKGIHREKIPNNNESDNISLNESYDTIINDLEDAQRMLYSTNRKEKYQSIINRYLKPYNKSMVDLSWTGDFIDIVGEDEAQKAVDELYSINESKTGGNKAYKVSLIGITDGEQVLYNEEVVMTKNESIKLAKKWISQHINEDEFFMTSISVGKTNWGKSADQFNSNRYLIAFSNKDQATTEDILGNDIYDYDKIIYQ